MSETDSTSPVEYRPIPGWSGYRAGDDGSIWSIKRGDWRRMTGVLDKDGYPRVCLSGGVCNQNCYAVHKLVMFAFVGARPEGMDICHRNGNPADNRLCNLRYDTSAANHEDCIKHGRTTRGERNVKAKLCETEVKQIRYQRANGDSRRIVANRFGVSLVTVDKIVAGLLWKHVV